ncbi:RICIN domain-containing protein [Methylobacterium terricola]|nr:RICIN domain-containing protein [Methylobacterium terricola]
MRLLLYILGCCFFLSPAQAQINLASGSGSGPLIVSHSGMCVAVPGATTTPAVQLVQQPCTGSPAQTWQAKPFGNGFTLVNQATGQCMDSQISNNWGSGVIQFTCNSSAQQTWSAQSQNGGYRLITAYSSLCLDVYNANTTSGTNLIQWNCSGSANQTFSGTGFNTFDFNARSGSGPIVASHSGLCVTVPGGTTSPAAQLQQQSCTGSPAQIWQVKPFGNGFTLVNQATGQCMDSQLSNNQGSGIIQFTCNNSAQQTWSAQSQNGGSRFTSAYSNLCLDVYNANKTGGTNLIQWTCSGAANQTFNAAGAGSGTAGGGTGGSSAAGGTGGSSGGPTPPGELPPAASGLIVAQHSAMCVEVPNAQMAAGVKIDQWPCDGGVHMEWSFVPSEAGYQLRNIKTNLCLTVDSASTTNGAGIVQQPCGTAGGLWRMRKVGAVYELVAVHSGRCLNVNNASFDQGGAVLQWDCQAASNGLFALVPPAAPSAWTPVTTLGLVPVSAALTPSGKVLMWAAEQKTSFGSGNGTWLTTFDPKTGASNDTYVANTNHDMFCPGTNLLSDGRMLITGGITAGGTSIYDPSTNQWSSGPTLKIPRGYNANVTLSTGEAMTYGGSWSGNIGGKNAEVWSPASGSWRVLSNVSGDAAAEPGVDMYRADNHFWMFGVSNGSVFHAGPSRQMHWIGTGGNGTLTSAGNRGDDAFAINGTATMVDVNRIYKAGGAPQYQNVPASVASYTIDIGGGPGSTPTVAATAPLNFARAFHNSVVLPTGDVVTIGGQSFPIPFTDTTPVYFPELWSPSRNTVVRLAPMAVPRTYHSVAILLPDARVLSAGGGLCGGCDTNHPNLQILTPPYLYGANGQLASRPAITNAPTSAALGSTITATTDRAVVSFALIRLSSTTHTVNNDQRRIPVRISGTFGTQYQLALPSDPGILTPGSWMLFAMDATGVPSVAAMIRIR